MKESPERRSLIMRSVKGADTGPELIVRRLAHRMGYRFRLHSRDLPGKPDIVFPRLRKVIFVNGCFWHGHDCPRGARPPKANAEYWRNKIDRNRIRDVAHLAALKVQGWHAMVIWECELKETTRVQRRLARFLSETDRSLATASRLGN